MKTFYSVGRAIFETGTTEPVLVIDLHDDYDAYKKAEIIKDILNQIQLTAAALQSSIEVEYSERTAKNDGDVVNSNKLITALTSETIKEKRT